MAPRIAPAIAQLIGAQASVIGEARHGDRGALVDSICAATGQSRATVYRQLGQLTVRPQRRRRSDSGKTSVTLPEAQLISSVLMESHRKNNKQLMRVAQVLDMLRHDGSVKCEAVDAATGEVKLLSASSVERALRMYRLHPEQLLRPAPAMELRSLHPNHVWQIDASLCVLYYLRAGMTRGNGLQVLDADKFYKNKPKALERVAAERVWRYVVTDHYSGAIFVHYVLGAESGVNLAESFIAAIQQREGDVMYGVPMILMMDMGSANTSGMFKNLARRLQVRTIAHMPGNARVTGQVEKAQDIWECHFEAALKFQPVGSLEELNDNARLFGRFFNSEHVHTRTRRSRAAVWQEITAEQLRLAPMPDVCRAMLTHEPELRKVTAQMTVSFSGSEYDVSKVPHVAVGERLSVSLNAYAQEGDSVCIVDMQADGTELLHIAPRVVRDAAGFREDANVIGSEWRRHAGTEIEHNRRLVERIATDSETDADAAAARKARVPAFGGRIDPLRQAREARLALPLPKRGAAVLEPSASVAAAAPERMLSHFEAARELVAHGLVLDAGMHALIRQWHPDGVPESAIDALALRLSRRPTLQVVNGGAR